MVGRGRPADEPLQMAPAHLVQQGLDFPLLPLHDQFHGPVGQIAHVTGRIESRGDLLHAVSESDPLHLPLVNHPDRFQHPTKNATVPQALKMIFGLAAIAGSGR